MSVSNGQNTDDIYERIRTAILDGELAAGAGHFARTGFEVIEILEPGYLAADLTDAVRDVGGEIPKKRRSNAQKEPR